MNIQEKTVSVHIVQWKIQSVRDIILIDVCLLTSEDRVSRGGGTEGAGILFFFRHARCINIVEFFLRIAFRIRHSQNRKQRTRYKSHRRNCLLPS